MDGEHFDRWTQGLNARLSRRGLTGLAAGALATLGFASADAKKNKKKKRRKKKKKCKNGGTRCNGSCVNTSQSTTHCGACGNACPSGTTCQNGSCTDQNGACTTECCSNSDCPSGGSCNQQTGQCVCPGNCCFDNDCAPNQACLNVNNTYNCFCKPQQVCGQVCCPANTACGNPNTSTCMA